MLQSIRNTRIKTPLGGFTLIELAIVLGVAGLLFAGLWRLLSGGNQQLRDQAAASSQIQMISAVKSFLASPDGGGFMTANKSCPQTGGNCNLGSNFYLPFPSSNNPAGSGGCSTDGNITTVFSSVSQAQTWCGMLPPGTSASTTNSYGQTFDTVSDLNGLHGVRILRDSTPVGKPPASYTVTVATLGGNIIPDSSGGRISASIGGDGGFIYSNNVCGNPPTHFACGAYGAWSVDINTFGYPSYPPTGGYIFSRSYVSPEIGASNVWVSRKQMPNDIALSPFYQTMSTDLYIGAAASNWQGHAVGDVGQINFLAASGGAAGAINMNAGAINMAAGPLHMAGGLEDGVASITMSANGPITMNDGNIVLGRGTLSAGVAVTTASLDLHPDGHISPAINISSTCTLEADSTCTVGAINVPRGDFNITQGRIQATSFYYTSDARLKTNIQPIVNGLEGIEKLKPVSFNYKATGKASLGIIAQDVEKVYPSLVVDNSEGYKSVAYNGLIAPLISAVQELKKENDELRAELHQQALRQEKLESMLKRNK